MPPLRHPINCSSVSESCAQERGANHTKREIGRTGGWYLLRADLISSRSVIHAGRTLAIAQAYLPNHFPRFIYILKLSRLAFGTKGQSRVFRNQTAKPKPQTAFFMVLKASSAQERKHERRLFFPSFEKSLTEWVWRLDLCFMIHKFISLIACNLDKSESRKLLGSFVSTGCCR